jgi:hypothetical protein
MTHWWPHDQPLVLTVLCDLTTAWGQGRDTSEKTVDHFEPMLTISLLYPAEYLFFLCRSSCYHRVLPLDTIIEWPDRLAVSDGRF